MIVSKDVPCPAIAGGAYLCVRSPPYLWGSSKERINLAGFGAIVNSFLEPESDSESRMAGGLEC
jgi:hypothetical protein